MSACRDCRYWVSPETISVGTQSVIARGFTSHGFGACMMLADTEQAKRIREQDGLEDKAVAQGFFFCQAEFGCNQFSRRLEDSA